MKELVSIDLIEHAAERIREKVIRTPLVYSPFLSREFGGEIYLKMENLQKTGSFKIRGAVYKLLSIEKGRQVHGVIAASAGNHAQGVALAANQAGIPSTIVMPEWSSISKQEATRGYGGEVIIFGQTIAESLEKAQELTGDDNLFIHPFDDPDIIAGQGTIGLEIVEELSDVDLILCPIGGGGLISGVALAVKSINPRVKIMGVQAAACPSASESLKHGKPVRVNSIKSIADGISVKQVGEIPFRIIKRFVDDVVLVDEDDISAAVLMLLEKKKILSEGSGAAVLAALLNESVKIPATGKTVMIVSGGNVDSSLLGRILRQGMMKNGRIMRFEVVLDDSPGALACLLSQIASLGANVLHISHDRNLKGMAIYRTRVDLEIETRGKTHIEKIAEDLKKGGYEIFCK